MILVGDCYWEGDNPRSSFLVVVGSPNDHNPKYIHDVNVK